VVCTARYKQVKISADIVPDCQAAGSICMPACMQLVPPVFRKKHCSADTAEQNVRPQLHTHASAEAVNSVSSPVVCQDRQQLARPAYLLV
jgi:hypothetical protein